MHRQRLSEGAIGSTVPAAAPPSNPPPPPLRPRIPTPPVVEDGPLAVPCRPCWPGPLGPRPSERPQQALWEKWFHTRTTRSVRYIEEIGTTRMSGGAVHAAICRTALSPRERGRALIEEASDTRVADFRRHDDLQNALPCTTGRMMSHEGCSGGRIVAVRPLEVEIISCS